MIFLMTHAHRCVCLRSEGETPEENDSITERNFPFVNQVTKEKLRQLRPLPYFCKKIENCALGNLYPWSNDRQIKWLRSRKTSPDLSPSPNSKMRAPGNFQETLQIEAGAVKMASAQQLREGPQDFTRQGVNGSGLAEGAQGKKRHSAGVVRAQVPLQCRWDKGILQPPWTKFQIYPFWADPEKTVKGIISARTDG